MAEPIAFDKCSEKLTLALSIDPLTIATKLKARGIIPREVIERMTLTGITDQTKATQLVLCVSKQIQLKAAVFHEFLNILGEENHLKVVADILREEYYEAQKVQKRSEDECQILLDDVQRDVASGHACQSRHRHEVNVLDGESRPQKRMSRRAFGSVMIAGSFFYSVLLLSISITTIQWRCLFHAMIEGINEPQIIRHIVSDQVKKPSYWLRTKFSMMEVAIFLINSSPYLVLIGVALIFIWKRVSYRRRQMLWEWVSGVVLLVHIWAIFTILMMTTSEADHDGQPSLWIITVLSTVVSIVGATLCYCFLNDRCIRVLFSSPAVLDFSKNILVGFGNFVSMLEHIQFITHLNCPHTQTSFNDEDIPLGLNFLMLYFVMNCLLFAVLLLDLIQENASWGNKIQLLFRLMGLLLRTSHFHFLHFDKLFI